MLQWLLRRFKVPRDAFRFAWKRYPEHIALISPARTLTYAELRDRVLRLVATLAALGLKKGDVCYVQLINGGDMVEASLASQESGIILTGLPRHADEEILSRAIQLIPARAMLYDADCEASATMLKRLLPDVALLRMDQIPEPSTPLAYSTAKILPEDTALIGFTSGTTGVPKVLAAAHGTYLTSLRLIVSNVHVLNARIPDVSLVGIPIAGAGSGLVLPTLLSGSALLIPEEYTVDEFLRLIEKYRVTRVFTTPSLLIDLLDHPLLDQTDLTSLRNILYGTELLPAAKLEEALRRFGPILQQGYGSAEVLPPVSMLQPHEHWIGSHPGHPAPRSVLTSVGRVVPQVQVIIADEEDHALPQGAIGNVLIKSPTQFKGYLHQPELNAQVLRGGWLHIGDMGYFDQDGLLHVLGRKPDLIIRHGHITYPRTVEEVLHDHPAVKETAYVQVGDHALMAVSLRHAWRDRMGDVSLVQELGDFLSSRVAAEDQPDGIALFIELPRSPLAKVLRREVRQTLSH